MHDFTHAPRPPGALPAATSQPAYRLSVGQTEEMVDELVRQIAGRLTTHRPEILLTATARIAVIQATTMTESLSRALRARLPEITGEITRAAYAALLHEALGGEEQ